MMSIIPNEWHDSWNSFMNENISLLKQIETEIGQNYYPNEKNVMRFLKCDLNNVKCIIYGMDPYSSDYFKNQQIIPVATGRSFEVDNINNWCEKFKQASLRNILKAIYYNKTNENKSLDEIRSEIKNNTFKILQPHQWFDSLEKQGVLFLNTALTVMPGNPNSHMKYWIDFTQKLIKYIDNYNNETKWLLWGNQAQTFVSPYIKNGTKINSCHPRIVGFIKENCFQYVPEINWLGRTDLYEN